MPSHAAATRKATQGNSPSARARPFGERKSAAAPLATEDVLVAHQPLVGMVLDDFESAFGELLSGDAGGVRPLNLTQAGRRRRSARAVRHFLREDEGQGYWDFFKPSEHLMVSITDATYRRDAWVHVEGTDFFKLRLLESGELRSEHGELLARGPSALLYVSPGSSREGYFITGNYPTRMVVLHCRPQLLTDLLGLEPADVPPPMSSLYAPQRGGSRHKLPLGPELARAAQRIIDSRHLLSRPLRAPYLEALGVEILTEMLAEFENQERMRSTPSALKPRDLNLIYEARDYLLQHYAQPPSIPELARLVGVNQTKLKTGFRQVIGKTIYDYILHCRMERACDLLRSGDYSVAEVAYKVGYEYPANFTLAFKKIYGKLPKQWMQNRQRED